jgi:hypothetical protein
MVFIPPKSTKDILAQQKSKKKTKVVEIVDSLDHPVKAETKIEGLPLMGQTLFKRVQSFSMMAREDSVDEIDMKVRPVSDLTAAETTKGSNGETTKSVKKDKKDVNE